MRPNYKPKLTNRPRHLKLDNSIYFLTVRTVSGQWFLRPDKYKEILMETIRAKADKFNFSIIAYAILQNHYHLMLKVADAVTLPKFMQELNGASARHINKADSAIDRKIWWNYYDHIIRDEADFFKHLNYIHQNPVKHGLIGELVYKFSSYNAWVKKRGIAYLNQAFEKYPIVDFMAQGDDF